MAVQLQGGAQPAEPQSHSHWGLCCTTCDGDVLSEGPFSFLPVHHPARDIGGNRQAWDRQHCAVSPKAPRGLGLSKQETSPSIPHETPAAGAASVLAGLGDHRLRHTRQSFLRPEVCKLGWRHHSRPHNQRAVWSNLWVGRATPKPGCCHPAPQGTSLP